MLAHSLAVRRGAARPDEQAQVDQLHQAEQRVSEEEDEEEKGSGSGGHLPREQLHRHQERAFGSNVDGADRCKGRRSSSWSSRGHNTSGAARNGVTHPSSEEEEDTSKDGLVSTVGVAAGPRAGAEAVAAPAQQGAKMLKGASAAAGQLQAAM